MEYTASARRVYVPISPPDSSAPTYAVLQFLGFSSPPSSSSSCSTSPPSSSSCSSSAVLQSPFPPNFAPSIPLISTPPSGFHNSFEPLSPPPSSICTKDCPGDSSCSDSKDSDKCKEKDRKFISVKPSPMKKSGVPSGISSGAVSPGSRKTTAGKCSGGTTATTVTQTERETIVHTHCSNFRDIVHQLTGASSDDKELLPVTLPARFINRTSSSEGGCNKQENPAKVEFAPVARTSDLGPRRATTKLLERRKSLKTLDRLSTTCRELPPLVPSPLTPLRELPPLVPSPITPLASDLEKICLPTTPTTSQGSTTIPPPQEGSVAVMDTLVTQQPATAEDLVIAGKGFFLHSQRPKGSDPTLLNLFPESPACSPRDR